MRLRPRACNSDRDHRVTAVMSCHGVSRRATAVTRRVGSGSEAPARCPKDAKISAPFRDRIRHVRSGRPRDTGRRTPALRRQAPIRVDPNPSRSESIRVDPSPARHHRAPLAPAGGPRPVGRSRAGGPRPRPGSSESHGARWPAGRAGRGAVCAEPGPPGARAPARSGRWRRRGRVHTRNARHVAMACRHVAMARAAVAIWGRGGGGGDFDAGPGGPPAVTSDRPVPSRPVPSRPVPSRPVPARLSRPRVGPVQREARLLARAGR
jgi:hypothetical protein